MKKIIYLIFIITIIWLVIQNNSLKDTLNKKDEEINQLQEHAEEAETNQSKAVDKLNHDFIKEFFSASIEKEKYEIGKGIMTDECLQKLFPPNHKENHSYEGISTELIYLESYEASLDKEEKTYLNIFALDSKPKVKVIEQKMIVKTKYIMLDGEWKLKSILIEHY